MLQVSPFCNVIFILSLHSNLVQTFHGYGKIMMKQHFFFLNHANTAVNISVAFLNVLCINHLEQVHIIHQVQLIIRHVAYCHTKYFMNKYIICNLIIIVLWFQVSIKILRTLRHVSQFFFRGQKYTFFLSLLLGNCLFWLINCQFVLWIYIVVKREVSIWLSCM